MVVLNANALTLSPPMVRTLSSYLTTPLITARFVLTTWMAIMLTLLTLIALYQCALAWRQRRRSRHHRCQCVECQEKRRDNEEKNLPLLRVANTQARL